jgi:hypothetical protein
MTKPEAPSDHAVRKKSRMLSEMPPVVQAHKADKLRRSIERGDICTSMKVSLVTRSTHFLGES